jgi:2'-5' RNA ligase
LRDVRCFIAISLPEDIVKRLAQQIASIKEVVPYDVIRWVREDNIHLTLKFLGNVPSNEITEVTKSIKRLAARHAAFAFEVFSFGCFPNLNSPRTLWIDIREPSGALLSLQSDLEGELAELGFPRERRRFHPHLTIGRVKRNVHRDAITALAESLAQIKAGRIGVVQVRDIRLMRSDLHPTGAVYSQLSAVALEEAV